MQQLFKSNAQAEVNLKFFTLDVIEVLIGYQEDQLTKPLWEPLTRAIYNEAIGETLFCRLKPYQNRIFGATRNKESELPTVDEYFLLQPRTTQAVAAVEDLAPGLSISAFPTVGTTFLFGDLPGITSQTFYVEPNAPTTLVNRLGAAGGLRGEFVGQGGEVGTFGDPSLEGTPIRTTDQFGELDDIVGFGINDLDPRLQGMTMDEGSFSSQGGNLSQDGGFALGRTSPIQAGSLTQDLSPMQQSVMGQPQGSSYTPSTPTTATAPTQTTRSPGPVSFGGSNELTSNLSVTQNARSAQRPDALLNTSRSAPQGGKQS